MPVILPSREARDHHTMPVLQDSDWQGVAQGRIAVHVMWSDPVTLARLVNRVEFIWSEGTWLAFRT